MSQIIFDNYGHAFLDNEYISMPKCEHLQHIKQTLSKKHTDLIRLQYDAEKHIAKATWKWRELYLTKEFPDGCDGYNAIHSIFQEAIDQLEREG